MNDVDRKKLETGLIRRTYFGPEGDGAVRMKSIDKESNTAEFVIGSEEPVKDWSWEPPRVLSMKGAVLKQYRANPVILYQHQHEPRMVIGNSTKVWTDGDKIRSLGVFDVEDEDLGKSVWGKVARGFVRAASMGFIVLRERFIQEGQKDNATGLVGPIKYATQWVLAEWSVVAVGGDSQALGRSGESLNEPSGEDIDSAAADNAGEPKFIIPSRSLVVAKFKLPLLNESK